MFSTEILSDRLARAKLETSRNRETERQQRIFDDKRRTIGVDREALDLQVKEKMKREEEAKKEEKAYDADVLHGTKAARILHNRLQKERRVMEKAVVTYRQQQQQPWHRREYDLNDPDRWKKTNRDDAQMILPGLLGEDPDSESRHRRQKQQLRDWLTQQRIEREAERRRQELEEQCYNQSIEKMNSEALQLQRLEMERRKAAAVATEAYNLAKIEEKRRHELENDKDEHAQGEQMGADPAACVGAPGLCPSSDRRTPPENLQRLTQFQKYQMEERRRAESERRQEEDRLDRARLRSARTALLTERQQARLSKQLRKHLDSTNAQLAQTHKQRKPNIERGSIDESFFSQFNTCSR